MTLKTTNIFIKVVQICQIYSAYDFSDEPKIILYIRNILSNMSSTSHQYHYLFLKVLIIDFIYMAWNSELGVFYIFSFLVFVF